MRKEFRVLSLLLALLLAACTPATALASEIIPLGGVDYAGFLGSSIEIVIDNVKVGVMDAEPAAIGLSARMLVGAGDARYMASGELTGAIGNAFAYAMCFEDGAYRVRMKNLSSDYTLSEAALDALDPTERPIDFPLVPPVQPKDVLALLAALKRLSAAQDEDFSKRPSYEPTAFRELGYNQPGSVKRVNVLGENLDLMFFEAALDAQAMDDMDDALLGATSEINAAQAELDAILAKYSPANLIIGQPLPEWERLPDPEMTPEPSPEPDPEQPDGHVKRGEHVDAIYRLWSDETASNTRSEKEVTVASGEGDKRVERHTSTVWEQHVDANASLSHTRRITTDKRERTILDERTEYRDDGGIVRYSVEAENSSHYEDGDFKMDTRDHTTIAYTIEPDGKHSMQFEWIAQPFGGQQSRVLFEVKGGPDGDDGALLSHVKTSVEQSMQSEEGGEETQLFALSASFDMHMNQSPLPEGSLMPMLGLDDGAAALELNKLSAEQKQALEAEMSTAAIIGSGSMMATPGVAKLIADVQSAMEKMYQEMFDRYAEEEVESTL